MRGNTRTGRLAGLALILLAAGSAMAQESPEATPPATRAPEDLEPAVNTSASPATPARAAPRAMDRIELEATQITGNRELPKVLYIVPWKRSDLGDLVGKPVNSLVDEVLTPVDRDVFRRENRYYQALQPAEAEK